MSTSISLHGGVCAQYDLLRAIVFLGMHGLNKAEAMIAAAHERFDAEGRRTDASTREFIARLVTVLGDSTQQLQAGKNDEHRNTDT